MNGKAVCCLSVAGTELWSLGRSDSHGMAATGFWSCFHWTPFRLLRQSFGFKICCVCFSFSAHLFSPVISVLFYCFRNKKFFWFGCFFWGHYRGSATELSCTLAPE